MLRIPAPMRLLAEKGAFNDWAAGDGFPRERYFKQIDELALTEAIGGDPEPKWRLLALVVADGIEQDGDLEEHVSANPVLEPADEEEWLNMCTAAAWVVIKLHRDECKKGTWAP